MPRVTFGVIVLNGEPFTLHTLRALYPFAHQIIVAEGAAPGARNIATPDGHSRDGTLEVLRRFQTEEDPDGKVTVVTAEDEGHPNGFWPGEKDEQSRAYAKRATGDYLWQVDIDEFYRAADMDRVLRLLADDPGIDALSFHQLTFWGGLDYTVDGWYLRRGAAQYHRLFRWGRGFEYTTHRPPTVTDAAGRNLRKGHWLDATATSAMGIALYHYSLLLPAQVTEKCDYYATADWARRTGAVEWANEAYMALGRPFRVHNVLTHPSWLERYEGDHPADVVRMVEELRASPGSTPLRRTDDIDALLDAWWYPVGRAAVRGLDPWERRARGVIGMVRGVGKRRRGPARSASRRAASATTISTARGAAAGAASAGPSVRPLRVLLVTKFAQGGGAERIASGLHAGLRGRGHESWLATAKGVPPDRTVLHIPRGRPPGGRPGALLRKAAGAFGPRSATSGARRTVQRLLLDAADPKGTYARERGRESFRHPGTAQIPRLPPERPDLIHCHNLHGDYFDLRRLVSFSARYPVALTLHDEWTFTGHCGYTLGCERWQTGCGSCPHLDVYPAIKRDGTRANWRAKREIYEASRLYVTAPSQWLLDRARVSILAGGVRGWRVIPNGVDRSVFRPGDQRLARERLGLAQEPFILLFAANQARRNPFKDWETVSAAAERAAGLVEGRAVLCLALGDDGPTRTFANGEMRFLPYRVDMADVAAFYQASDLYLHAAKADNLPTTILEALATGLPVVATGIGGIPEEVRSLEGAPGAWSGETHGSDTATGVLVGAADAEGMGKAAAALLGDEVTRQLLARNAEADAAARFDAETQVDVTLAWYREIIADWQAQPRT